LGDESIVMLLDVIRRVGALPVAPGLAALLTSVSVAPVYAQGMSLQANPTPASPPAASGRAAAMATAPPSAEDDEVPDAPSPAPATTVKGVTVTAHRKPPPQPGAVVGDIKPELQLSPGDIQSYGVSTVTELLEELAPETRSDRGRGGESPVVLLNGRRISGFNEIQNIPTEAILRVDILPEEVSLKYGYTADQRVVNIVLRRRFRAITGELQGGGPTEGGRENGQAEADLLHIRGDNRLNLDLKYVGASQITDAARGIIEPTPNTPYDLTGNITAAIPGAQIDPALSALAGRTATVAGIPAGLGGRALTLGDLAATAGVPNVTDIGDDRTLSPATQSLTANAVLAKPLPLGINATFNGTLGVTTSDSLQGLPGLSLTVPAGNAFSPFGAPVVVDRYGDQPLTQSIDTYTAHLGSTLNRDLSDWRLSLTDAYDVAQTNTETDAGIDATPLQNLLNAGSTSFNPFAPLSDSLITAEPESRARSLSNAANIQILANGPLLKLPAGQLYVSAKAGDTQSWLNSETQRLAQDQSVDLARNDANAQLNVDIPLASRDNHVFGFLGDFSINFNAAVDQLSDYGTLKAFGYGVNWTPIPGYNLIVSHTNDQAAPTIQQLGNPRISTPGVAVFDYATGQTVDATVISGGNPNLEADNRNVFKVGLTLKPIPTENLTITANYIKSDIDHAIATFPAADAAIEAAFSSRFVRNASGELTEEDDTPVNFAKSDRTELRWGFNYSRPIGPQPPPRPQRFGGGPDGQRRRNPDGSMAPSAAAEPRSASGATPSGPPGAGPGQTAAQGGGGDAPRGGYGGGGGRGGGAGRFGGGFGGGGRFQIAVYHTVYFVDREIVTPGGPTLDLLNGAAASSTGGQYRNEVEGQLGATLFGFGGRLSADWRSATFVKGGASSSTGDLFFSDITTINLRLFDNLGQQPWMVKAHPWLRGARVTLNITNLFDQRIGVRDGAGATPIGYQGGYLDPIGRAITLDVRKLFF
jgi:hypothetical protein